MKKLINRLRGEPEEVRRHVLHIFIFIVGFILFAIWAISLGTTVTNIEPPQIFNESNEVITGEEEIPEVW